MDYVFTVTSTGTDRVDGLLRWLRQDAPAGAWSELPANAPDSVDVRVRGDALAAARFARSLIDWLNLSGRTAATITVTVDAPSGRTSVVLTSRQTDLHELVDKISQLAGREDAVEGTVVGHTSPGPVLDPDDDWAREGEES
ncbi:hypothetical protein ACFV2N_32885 [Streptomyces sp. NPDC059680]|uniref:hypothetical protein n=1 Tax=Streptomyces sp. NPDC059680 TaxID=3346904 RepID=UPI0036ACBA5D